MPIASLFDPHFVNRAGVDDLAALQQELGRLLYEVDPQGGLEETVTLVAGMLHRYSAGIVHVDTGRLKNSLFWNVEHRSGSVMGHVATNVEYAPAEEARGGTHAFFARTRREEGPRAEELFGVRIFGERT